MRITLKENDNKQVGVILRIGDPYTGHPLLATSGKALALECRIDQLKKPRYKRMNELTTNYLKNDEGGWPNRAPIQMEMQADLHERKSSYPYELLYNISCDWVPPALSAYSPILISFDVMRNGNVANLKLEKSSGERCCDEAALSSIRQNYSAFSTNSKTNSIHFSVRYGALASTPEVVYSGVSRVSGISEHASLLATLGKEIREAYFKD